MGGPGSTASARLAGQDRPSTTEARELLRRLGAKPVKGLGQHFLVDRTVQETIVSAADLGPGDTVIEVGPGLGVLTQELARRAGRVIAVEVDPRLSGALRERLSQFQHLTVVNADVLDVQPQELVATRARPETHPPPYKVVANLPYYVAAPILRHFLEASLKPSLMVVMVQREVAQSIAASPGAMSILAVSVQLYGKPRIVDYVPASCFYPRPKVDSAIVRIEVYPELAVKVSSVSSFFELVKAGFSAPRKQLRNSLAQGLGVAPSDAEQLLRRADIAPQRRPEALSLDEWARLLGHFEEKSRG